MNNAIPQVRHIAGLYVVREEDHRSGCRPARSVWLRLGNCRTTALIEAFDRLWPRIERVATVSAFLTVGFSHARYPTGEDT